MICYQDEKMYGAYAGMKTAAQLEEEIKALETDIYGESTFSHGHLNSKRTPMIYDIQQGMLVERKKDENNT